MTREIKENQEIARKFAKTIMELWEWRDDNELEELLEWTIWTLYKWYDVEEQEEAIEEDTLNWLTLNADYMKDD